MQSKFDIAFDYVIENECGLNEDPRDRGGLTKWGISEKFIESLKDDDTLVYMSIVSGEENSYPIINETSVALIKRANGIKLYISKLQIEQAKWIYEKYFWLSIYEQIEDQDICNYIFDMTVQHGKQKAAELTQRASNAMKGIIPNQVIDKHALKIDGIFGKDTILTLKSLSNWRGQYFSIWREPYFSMHFKSLLIAVRESLFRCIVANDKTQEDKLDGWLKRCYR